MVTPTPGPRDLRTEVADLTDVTWSVIQQLRRAVVAVLLAALVIVAAIIGAYLLIKRNSDHITRQSVRVEQLVYDQCVTRNQGTARQNALIDSAIAAERRKPVPDAKRLHDLTEFRGSIVGCGKRPG